MNQDIIKHVHGFSRTLADLVIARHQETNFTSAKEVIEYLEDKLERIRINDNEMTFLSLRTFQTILDTTDVFVDGILQCDVLYHHLLSYELVTDCLSVAYDLCFREKLYNVITYFNRYKNYKSSEAIQTDLKICGLLPMDESKCDFSMYYGFHFPMWVFKNFIEKRWSEIAPDGKFDIRKLNELMFENQEKDLENLGLDTMIKRKYISFSSCHPDVLYPNEVGYGPVYVKTGHSRYSRACGKGLFTLNHFYETSSSLYEQNLYCKVLEKDKGYAHIGNYYIPKWNWTLPVFEEYGSEMKFKNGLAKIFRIIFIVLTRGVF